MNVSILRREYVIFWALLLRKFSNLSSKIEEKRLFQSSGFTDRLSPYEIAKDSRVGSALVIFMFYDQGMDMLFPAT